MRMKRERAKSEYLLDCESAKHGAIRSLYISQSEQLFENADRLLTRKACVRD